MKKILLFLFIIITQTVNAQILHLYFDGFDDITVRLDSNTNDLWEIGIPQKSLFSSAFSPPNAILTKRTTTYPTDVNASFSIAALIDTINFITAFEWTQKIDIEEDKDMGVLEFSFDDSLWLNAFSSPYVYNFYGFDASNVDTLQDGTIGFTGTDNSWKNVWLCFDTWMAAVGDSIYLRYRFVSDSVDTGQEGWMIDNFLIHYTIVHTIKKVEENQKSTSIFPNPTRGVINIASETNAEAKLIKEINIIDGMAKVVQTYHDLPIDTQIDIGHLPTGVYFLQVKTDVSTESHRLLLLSE